MSYATIAQADLVLITEPWISLSTAQKQSALDIGVLWIDDNAVCVATDPVQDNLVQANILLADKYANNKLFEIEEGVIISKSVKADTVESSKEYQAGTQLGANPFAEVQLLLGSVCEMIDPYKIETVRA